MFHKKISDLANFQVKFLIFFVISQLSCNFESSFQPFSIVVIEVFRVQYHPKRSAVKVGLIFSSPFSVKSSKVMGGTGPLVLDPNELIV